MRLLRTLLLIGAGLILISIVSLVKAQGETTPKTYLGSGDCGDCHRGTARDHDGSPHVKAFQDATADKDLILADFSQDSPSRLVTFPDESDPRPFTAEDVAYVMGQGRKLQVYLYQNSDGMLRILPAEWDTVNGQWLAYGDGIDWLTNSTYDWAANCAGCHVTGLTLSEGGQAEWVEDGVQCEACHGAGSLHVELADTLSRRASDEELQAVREAIVLSADAQMCGQCHSQGTASASNHPYPLGYEVGTDLLAVFDLVASDDPAFWWGNTGHARQPNMQFNEWLTSAHANSLETLKASDQADETCLGCHSGDYRWTQQMITAYDNGDIDSTPPELPTLETAQLGITCTTCHNPHANTEESTATLFLRDEPLALCSSCHSDVDFSDGIHHPDQQMVEGVPVVEQVAPIPSAHFTAEESPDCLTCHMAQIPMPNSFTTASHSWQILAPAAAAEVVLEDTCSGCHSEQAQPLAMQALIDDIQTGTETRLTAIQAALTGNEPEWVGTALAFVQQDGSSGVHNYAYTDALLDALETELAVGGEQ